jgi:hypothetical protein
MCVLIYYASGCYRRAFLCFRTIYVSVVTNTRITHSALSHRLSSFAKWTVPVAGSLQIQSNWLRSFESEGFRLTDSHSWSLRTEPEEQILINVPLLFRRLLASSCLSVRPHGTTRCPLNGFSWKFIFEYFRKFVERVKFTLKSCKNEEHFVWRRFYIYDNISLNFS